MGLGGFFLEEAVLPGLIKSGFDPTSPTPKRGLQRGTEDQPKD